MTVDIPENDFLTVTTELVGVLEINSSGDYLLTTNLINVGGVNPDTNDWSDVILKAYDFGDEPVLINEMLDITANPTANIILMIMMELV